jgi:enoyl-CoA hydratase
MGRAWPAAGDLAASGAIDRVLPAADLHPKAEAFARRLSSGPTSAFAVVKELAAAYLKGGIAGADALLIDAAVGLFDTDDARDGIRRFLEAGPGQATFIGR